MKYITVIGTVYRKQASQETMQVRLEILPYFLNFRLDKQS